MNLLIGKKIKQLRHKKGYSQEYLADSLCISQPTLARIEAGKSNSWVSYINKISEIFELKPEDFLKPDKIDIKNKNSIEAKAYINDTVLDKLISQYEKNAKLKEEIIADLRSRLTDCENKNK
jgi:transcriptional regulator with XRE-family HTH domain